VQALLAKKEEAAGETRCSSPGPKFNWIP